MASRGKSAVVAEITPAVAPPVEESLGSTYLHAIRSHIAVVALVTLAALLASIAFVQLRDQRYVSAAELLITPLPQDDTELLGLPLLRDTGDATRTSQTAAALLRNREAAALTARRLGGDWTTRGVADAITIEPRGQTNLLVVQAEAGSAAQAVEVADAYARAAMELQTRDLQRAAQTELADTQVQIEALDDADDQARAQLQGRASRLRPLAAGTNPTLSLAERAVPNDNPLGPPVPLVIALALVAGVVVATATALVIELAQPDRIMREADLRRIAPLPVLVRVPAVRRGRGRPLELLDEPEVHEAFRNLRVQLELRGRSRRAVMLVSASRGDGQTTTALGLALELADGGSEVVLLDGDVRRPQLRGMLGLAPRKIPKGFDGAGERAAQSAEEVHAIPGLSVLEQRELLGAEPSARSREQRAAPLRALLRTADYVIVDTPPLGQSSDALMLLREVDDVLLVVRPGHTRRSELESAWDVIRRSGVSPLGTVVTGSTVRSRPLPEE